MLRLLPSDPLYPAWDWLLSVRAAFINAKCHFDLARYDEALRRADLAMLDEMMVEAFEELVR